MQVLKINYCHPEATVLRQAAAVLKGGGAIVYPADTAGYSLGANALDETAVRKIFLIKQRKFSKPLNIVVASLAQAKKLVRWSPTAELLAQEFLPGPLALVLPKRKIVPDVTTAGQPTVGIRIPDSPVALALVKQVHFPLTMTTANISETLISSYNLQEILTQFGGEKIKPDLVLDCGQLPKVPPSTILDLTVSPPRILRHGPISAEQIGAVLGCQISVG